MFDDEPINSLLLAWQAAWGTAWTPHYVSTYIDRLAKLLALKYTQANWHEPAAANLLPDAPEPEDSGSGEDSDEDYAASVLRRIVDALGLPNDATIS